MQNRWSEKVLVRTFSSDDLESVVSLESSELSGWSCRLVEEELGRHDAVSLVAVGAEQILGWCSARYIGDEAELLKICVEQRFRHSSYGTQLITTLQDKLFKDGVTSLFLELRSRNEAAALFYSRLGFTPVGRRINYYSLPLDDALVLKKQISSIPPNIAEVNGP